MKFLDSTGLGVLWNKIKSSFLSLNGGGIIGNKDDTSQETFATEIRNGSISLYGSTEVVAGPNHYFKPTHVMFNVDGYHKYIRIFIDNDQIALRVGSPNEDGQYYLECDTAITIEELNEVLV